MRLTLVMAVVLAAVPVLATAQSSHDPAVADVLAFEREVEAAIVRAMSNSWTARVRRLHFTHGDGWTTGGQPLRVDNRAQWMAVVKSAPYASRELDSVAWRCTATWP
jgi:hypothetical protein